jgi:hypothetical protein
MIETTLMMTASIAIVTVFLLLRNGLKFLANAVCGGIILFFVWHFNLAPIDNLSVAQIIVCAIGGLLGVALLIILAFFGIVI